MNAKVMQEGFTKWFFAQQGVVPRLTNPYLIQALCEHVVAGATNGHSLTEFDLVRGSGTTSTLILFAQWLELEQVIKGKGSFIFLVGQGFKGLAVKRGSIVQGHTWLSSFRGYRQCLFLCESDRSESLHLTKQEEKTTKLLSFSNSVFYARPGIVDTFLQAVDN